MRAGGLPHPLASDADAPLRRSARQLGLDLIETARPELRRCYEVAMTRDPIMVARVEVQLTVQADGRVSQPRLTDGSLVDAEGDACLAQALRDTALPSHELGQPLALVVPIQFFLQDATYDSELFWRERPNGAKAYGSTAGADPMPAIDFFDFSSAARR